MRGRFEVYSDYGLQEVQLIGRIPKGWSATPLKVLGELGGGAGFPHDYQGDPDQEIEFHKVNALAAADARGYLIRSQNTVSPATAARLRAKVFPASTIVFAKVGAALLLSRFRRLKRLACLDNNMMGLIVRRGHSPEFVKLALEIIPMSYIVNPGAVPSVNEMGVGNLRLPTPPREEQTQIAKFLDYETAKIDALIEKQQQLIALLKEKRQAVISHAVTKGLNPDVPLRDSGIEWLGKVPAHWEVCRVKQATSFITSGPRGWSDLISDDGLDVFLQSGDLNDKLGLRLGGAKRISPPRNAETVRTKMQDGDVVVCVTGANTGRVAVAVCLEQAVYVNQHLSLVRPLKNRVLPKFLATVLSSTGVSSYFAVKQYGLKGGLSLADVANAPISLPSLEEQAAVVAHLDVMEEKLERLEMAAEAQVQVLQERRTALISAAVTGKIDVRGWQAPESAAEAEVA